MVAVLAACKHAPEADPAQFKAIVDNIYQRVPGPAGIRPCNPDEIDGVTMTRRTVLILDGKPIDPTREYATWINPTELDSPPIRALADPASDATAKRRAAAELLAAPAYLVYRVDMVNAPLALRNKDPRVSTVGGRIHRYDKTGAPVCGVDFVFQGDTAKTNWAIKKVFESGQVSEEVAAALREDLHDQYLRNVAHPALTAVSPP